MTTSERRPLIDHRRPLDEADNDLTSRPSPYPLPSRFAGGEGDCYRPWNTGSRFSTKAAAASL